MSLKEDKSELSLWATLLAVPPICVFFLADTLIMGFRWEPDLPSNLPRVSPGWPDASARMLMIAAALALFVTSYLIVLRFVSDVNSEFGPKLRKWLWRWFCAGAVFGAVWSLKTYWLREPLSEAFVEAAVNALAGGQGRSPLLANFQALSFALRFVTTMAAGMVVMGAISCLATPAKSLPAEQQRAWLRHQHQRLRTYVNLSSVMLVSSIAFQIAWMRWLALLFPGPEVKAYLGYVDAAALHLGVTASAVIACFALPVSSLLAGRLAGLPLPRDGEDDDGLFDAGLLNTVGKVLVVLAPALAGVIPAIVEGLPKIG